MEALLGTGGFAWVYRAHDPDLDIPVALKVLKPQYAGDPAFVERFRREASTAARLRHPNVITIYNVGQDGDAVYFAMDYLPQGLSSRLEVSPTVAGPALVRIALDVAGALGFAHRQGVVHRDIKPDNILFDEHGNAVVADFGIARALTGNTRQTATQMVVGTPHYFAPEQARGLQLDGRADLYALGVTLYRAAAGTLPFPGEDWYEVARAHVEQEPTEVRQAGAIISTELATIIHRLLEKEPADRFQDAEELVAALNTTPEHGGTPVSVTAARTVAIPAIDRLWTTTGMTARRRRLRRRVLMGGASGAVILLALGTLYTLRLRTPAVATAEGADSLAVYGDSSMPTLDTVTVAAPTTIPTTPAQETPTTPPTLRVTAPAEASVLVDGKVVGGGSWVGTNLKPGTHVVAAELTSIAGCDASHVERQIVLASGRTEVLELEPRACGMLAILPQVGGSPLPPDAGGRYTVSDGGRITLTGKLPLEAPLVLPVGRYELRVDNVPLCSQFSGNVDVAAGAAVTPRIVLLCER